MGGLAPAEPGYRKLVIQPRPGGGLRHAWSRHLTPYGLAECVWAIHDGNIEVKVVVPPNTTATVHLPGNGAPPIDVGSGEHRWSHAYGNSDDKAVSVDDSVSTVRANPRAWTALMATLRQRIPDYAFVEAVLQSDDTASLRQVLASRPDATAVLVAVGEAIAN